METGSQESCRRASVLKQVGRGPLVVLCMKKIRVRDPLNSIAMKKFKVFRIRPLLEGKGTTKYF